MRTLELCSPSDIEVILASRRHAVVSWIRGDMAARFQWHTEASRYARPARPPLRCTNLNLGHEVEGSFERFGLGRDEQRPFGRLRACNETQPLGLPPRRPCKLPPRPTHFDSSSK